ncbi:MAG: alpha/beta fold hydrolase [Acidimicrobiales bacterium]
MSAAPELPYEVHPGEGPFCLLVHGILASRANWRPNLAALGAVCRPVVVELWGHGRSPSPDEPAAYRPDAYVAQFERIRTELGAPRWLLVGQSMGAGLTLRYALDHPERVIAQVFTNSTSGTWRRWEADRARPIVAKDADAFRSRGRAALEDHMFNPAKARRVDPELKAEMVAQFAEHDPHGVAHGMVETMCGVGDAERFAEMAPPTLLALGEEEKGFLARVELCRRIPGLELSAHPAGHSVNLHDPAGFNAAVTAFFRRWLTDPPARPGSA